jgi:hypothetical protein
MSAAEFFSNSSDKKILIEDFAAELRKAEGLHSLEKGVVVAAAKALNIKMSKVIVETSKIAFLLGAHVNQLRSEPFMMIWNDIIDEISENEQEIVSKVMLRVAVRSPCGRCAEPVRSPCGARALNLTLCLVVSDHSFQLLRVLQFHPHVPSYVEGEGFLQLYSWGCQGAHQSVQSGRGAGSQVEEYPRSLSYSLDHAN